MLPVLYVTLQQVYWYRSTKAFYGALILAQTNTVLAGIVDRWMSTAYRNKNQVEALIRILGLAHVDDSEQQYFNVVFETNLI